MAHTEVTVTELTYNGRTIGVATTTISRLGQDSPDEDDQVAVQVELALPEASENAPQTLHPELQFGERVEVFGSDLTANWSSISGRVARTQDYKGTDYTTLFATASAYASTELAKLTDALAAREAALVAAG
jgi:hypothetical protein